VSSFGFSGTNGHVVVQEAPPRTSAAERDIPNGLFCLSAKTEKSLRLRVRISAAGSKAVRCPTEAVP